MLFSSWCSGPRSCLNPSLATHLAGHNWLPYWQAVPSVVLLKVSWISGFWSHVNKPFCCKKKILKLIMWAFHSFLLASWHYTLLFWNLPNITQGIYNRKVNLGLPSLSLVFSTLWLLSPVQVKCCHSLTPLSLSLTYLLLNSPAPSSSVFSDSECEI